MVNTDMSIDKMIEGAEDVEFEPRRIRNSLMRVSQKHKVSLPPLFANMDNCFAISDRDTYSYILPKDGPAVLSGLVKD